MRTIERKEIPISQLFGLAPGSDQNPHKPGLGGMQHLLHRLTAEGWRLISSTHTTATFERETGEERAA